MVKIRKGLMGEMDAMQQRMERMMESVLQRHGATPGPADWCPPADLYETAEGVVVLLEVAGVDPDSLEVTLEGTVLRVQGRRSGPTPRHGCVALHQVEIEFGPFDRLFTVPGELDRDGARATLANGFLEISIPKLGTASTGSGRVEIKTG